MPSLHLPTGQRLRPRTSVELAIVFGVFFLYKLVRFLALDDARLAVVNARRVVDLERWVGLWIEPELQSLTLRSAPVIELLNQFYARIHLISTAGVLLFLFVVDPTTYRWLRRRLVGVTLVALVIHVAFPLAPPRLVGATGMIDTLQRFGPAIYQNGSALSRVANPYAAMPSLHFGYAVLLAWALTRRSRRPIGRLWLLHPAAMFVAIMVTANHYWLDAIVCALIIAIVHALLSRRSRERGHADANPAAVGSSVAGLGLAARRTPHILFGTPHGSESWPRSPPISPTDSSFNSRTTTTRGPPTSR